VYKLEIIDEAKQELHKEIAYSKKMWGDKHSRQYAKKLRESIQGLRKNPRLYSLRNDILPGIRILTYKGNRVIYITVESRKLVSVLAVLSNFQNIDTDKLSKRKQNI